jgi:hypothetical protein
MKIDRLNTGLCNERALTGYFRERDMHDMVGWLRNCEIRFDTVLWCGRSKKVIVELYVWEVPKPDSDRDLTREENALREAFKELCDPEDYLGFLLFQLDGPFWRDPRWKLSQPRAEKLPSPFPLPDLEHEVGLNNCFFPSDSIVNHDDLRFRSPAEVSVYTELKKRRLLFFPNAAAVLGPTSTKREPDFLICYKGRWGVLEVMGETYHTNAVKDHDRARLFKEHGLLCIEFFPAKRCETEPAIVVNEFLAILGSHYEA